MFFSGVPTVFAYHLSDWAAFFLETVSEAIFDEENDETSSWQPALRETLSWM